MKQTVLLLASAVLLASAPTAVFAQRELTLVEGAACAHLSYQIETLGAQNETMVNAIAEIQDSGEADRMLAAYERLVSLRKGWMEEYDRVCSRGVMSASNLKRVCRTESGAFDFRSTAFCKPLVESGL